MSKYRIFASILAALVIVTIYAYGYFTQIREVTTDNFTAIAVDTKYREATYFKQFPHQGAMWMMEWKSPASDRYVVETHNGYLFGTNVPSDRSLRYLHGFYVVTTLPDVYSDLEKESLEKVENIVFTTCEILTKYGRKPIECFEYPLYLQAKSILLRLDYSNRIKGVKPNGAKKN